ncbi:thionin-like protein 2 [Melia azedarach]|uniref:Thionin-like protein 2 n=1 Tax=Melia azedarach TaxID=155640 RepID=A0ACC1Y594_MELAZ|nr:thionin-like protein 2 [Melia azedarach]
MEKISAVVQFLLMAALVLGLLVGRSTASCYRDCSRICHSHPSQKFQNCLDDCLKMCNPGTGNNAQYFCKLGCASSSCAKLSSNENPAGKEEAVKSCEKSCSKTCTKI